MNTPTYLQKQFTNLNAVFHGITDDLTDEEWISRPAPGQNMIGYIVWHLPKTQDTFVQTCIRDVAEIARSEGWSHWRPLLRFGIGAGITLDEADEIARSVRRAEVAEYADAVHQSVLDWLGQCSDNDLDRFPGTRQRLSAFPEYQTPGFIEEVTDLYDVPVWGLLMRPCMGHIHRHLGELEIVKNVLRAHR